MKTIHLQFWIFENVLPSRTGLKALFTNTEIIRTSALANQSILFPSVKDKSTDRLHIPELEIGLRAT